MPSLQSVLNSLFGSYNDRQIKSLRKRLPTIRDRQQTFSAFSEAELKAKFAEWRSHLSAHPETVDDYLEDVFGGICAACQKLQGHTYDIRGKEETWVMVPYDVQLIGGMVLHHGNIAEMKTGEGKTLTSTLPVILNALTGRGVHVITVNDYLAQRDAEWMTPLFDYCGLTSGVIVHGVTPTDRQAAYAADITYGTNNEFGFDYLRDNMAQDPAAIVQRDLHFAIVDEVDSILIDEARTPLIISAPAEESTDKYQKYSKLITRLQPDDHYVIDEKRKSVTLTEEGIQAMEAALGVQNIYTEAGFDEVHHIENALKANVVFEKDRDYVVRDGEVVIVDEFTGRMMPGRRYSDGLHQALEAKERVDIKRESKTLATITFQNYFRLYDKLSGMTGTAETEAEEFAKIYQLDTLVVPTNKPVIRQDLPDKIFMNEKGKLTTLAKDVKAMQSAGRPVLIGTISIEKSELISQILTSQGVRHEVLNAKQHEREAEIVAAAGQPGAVTIATNMAGRGTDIKITPAVREQGGLAILGTERHESRRIDNQLRGRAGRQGDPGMSQFYVGLDDELMRRFGGDRMRSIMQMLQIPEDEAIENKSLSRSVESAQKRIEGFHFDARKHVVQYDDVMNIHREKIYTRRRKLLGSEDILADIESGISQAASDLVTSHLPTDQQSELWDISGLVTTLAATYTHPTDPLTVEELTSLNYRHDVIESVQNYLLKGWDTKRSQFPDEQVDRISRYVVLRSIDELWLEHINDMTHLRDRVALSGYAQKDPVMEYKRLAYEMFVELNRSVRLTAVRNLFRVQLTQASTQPLPTQQHPEATTNQADIEASLEDTGEYEPTAALEAPLVRMHPPKPNQMQKMLNRLPFSKKPKQ